MGYDYYLTLISRLHTKDEIKIIRHNRFEIENYFYAVLSEIYICDTPKYNDGEYSSELDIVYTKIINDMLGILKLTKHEIDRLEKELKKSKHVIKIDHTFELSFRNDDKVIILDNYVRTF